MNAPSHRRTRSSSSSLLAGVALAAGCGGVPPPAAPVAPAAPPASAAPSAAAAPAAQTPLPASTSLAPAPLPEPLPPLTRPITSVTLPGVDFPLFSVQGRSPRDIWFLAGDDENGGNLVHYEAPRARIVAHWTYEDYLKPPSQRPVKNDFMSVFSYGPHTPFFLGVYLDREEVVLQGTVTAWARGPGMLRGSLGKRGKWSWDSTFWQGLTFSSGDHVWTIDCSPMWRDCRFGVSRGPSVPLPARDGSFGERALALGALWMRDLDDGWMTVEDEDGRPLLLRYNGVDWAPLAVLDGDLAVLGLWADEAGHAWLTARRGKEDGPGNVALHFDGHALRQVPVPASFAAVSVRGTGARDVWFLGAGRKVYQWDGAALRQGEAPFDVGDAWAASGGEVWFVSDGKGPKGMAARVAPTSEVRR
jgi:hypothetical protein